jgi:hypothetical protein
MRLGMRAGPFWVSTSTRSRRRPAKDRLSGNDKVLIVVALAAFGAVVYGGAYAVAWPLIVFHHRPGWPYAWKAEGWWVGGWIAAAYLLRTWIKRRRTAKEEAAWIPVTGTVSWRGTAPDMKLVFAVDNGKTYVIPVPEGRRITDHGNVEPARRFARSGNPRWR